MLSGLYLLCEKAEEKRERQSSIKSNRFNLDRLFLVITPKILNYCIDLVPIYIEAIPKLSLICFVSVKPHAS